MLHRMLRFQPDDRPRISHHRILEKVHGCGTDPEYPQAKSSLFGTDLRWMTDSRPGKEIPT